MEQHELHFDYKARYHRLGKLDHETKQLWFVLHGYGQLAQFFIQKFKALEEIGICIVAPEGLSRFYLNGNIGRVGATWMTKENRLVDIENYVKYLDEVYKKEINGATSLPSITLLGFSQGAATAARWLMNNTIKPDRLILWAGLFPPDMDVVKGGEVLASIEVVEVYGKQDPFITAESMQQVSEWNKKLRIQPTVIQYEGKHELNNEVLLKLI